MFIDQQVRQSFKNSDSSNWLPRSRFTFNLSVMFSSFVRLKEKTSFLSSGVVCNRNCSFLER